MLASSEKASHSAHVLVAKMAFSSICNSVLLRAWSAYWEPGQRSNSSGLPTPSQKFRQKACSEAMNRMWPSDAS